MRRVAIGGSWMIVTGLLAACGDDSGGSGSRLRQGGDTTVDDRTSRAFEQPAANLDADEQRAFRIGSQPFIFHWRPPELGPLFNNDSCLGCHGGNGRGLSQIGTGEPVSEALIRISLLDGVPEEPGGNVPVPELGLQLQDHGVSTLPEVFVTLSWSERSIAYGDGSEEPMRVPVLDVRRPDGSRLGPDVRMSYRQGPGVFGLGLLEAVPDAALEALADPDDANGDGISGRINRVWDPDRQAMVPGRFGHKATVATLRQQTAGAFANDMGLTSRLIPEPDGRRDVADEQLDQTVFFVSTIGVPAAAPQNAAARDGERLFAQLGCAGCHTPTLTTGGHPIAQVSHQTIHPYTDLLLHDVGDLLTDARRDVTAEGVEWRTPPLWGLGLVQLVSPDATFLHDGRARTIAEAILWHGGEATAAREAFRLADRAQRDALISFLQTL